MQKKTVLITGGARGIGAELVRAFSGAYSTIFTYNASSPEQTLNQNPHATALEADLRHDAQVADLPAKVIAAHGRLDVIINNAALLTSDSVETFDPKVALEVYKVNVLAPQMLAAAALPHLKPGACILNITSTNARLPAMAAHSYSASKAALETWTRIAAKTLGPKGIRVNAIAPGAINTPEAPRPDALTQAFLKDTSLGHLATPQDIAATALFLASDAAQSINGHILDVNAGYRL